MPARHEYEEKQFEIACNCELGLQHPHVFPIGQVLEAICGYDVAAFQTHASPIWNILGGACPTGILLNQIWPAAANNIPTLANTNQVNLFLQYKRSEFCDTPTHRQWHLWNRNYYRFDVRLGPPRPPRRQINILQWLETQTQNAGIPLALVFYSAPAFHEYRDLVDLQVHRRVLDNCNFVRPSTIAAHNIWTFDTAGTAGLPNPSGERSSTSTFTQITSQARTTSAKLDIYNLLRRTAAALGIMKIDKSAYPRWLAKFTVDYRKKNKLKHSQISAKEALALYDLISVATLLAESDAMWYVMQFPTAKGHK